MVDIKSEPFLGNKSSMNYYNTRLASMARERESFEHHWQQLSAFISPHSGRFLDELPNNGNRKYGNIINSRATQALRVATAGIFTGTMEASRPWFKFETMDPDMMGFAPVRDWLYQVENLIRQIFFSSNLYNMAPVMFKELLLYGTSAMSQLDDFNDVTRFYTHTAGSYFIGQDDRFNVNTFATRTTRTAEQLIGRFGMDNVSIAVKSAYDTANYEARFRVVQFIEPNPDHDPEKLESANKPFRTVYYEQGAAGSDASRYPDDFKNNFLEKSGFEEFPVHVIRWDLSNEDTYGTDCPAMVALGDTKGLQIMERRKAQGLDKMVTPVLTGPPQLKQAAVSKQNIPSGYIANDGSGERVQSAYQVNVPFQEMSIEMDRVEQRINEAFFVNLFMAITQRKGIQPVNQMELSMRDQEALMQLGPPLGRIHREFQASLIERTFRQAERAGILPPMPEEMEGMPLNIKFISALALAQQFSEIGSLERYIMFGQGLAQTNPEALLKIDAISSMDSYARMTGVQPSAVRSNEEVEQIMQQQAEAAQAQADRQAEVENANAAQMGAQAVESMGRAEAAE